MVYKLNEETASALRTRVEQAMTVVQEPLEGTERLIRDIYTGRDPLGGAARLFLGDQGIPLNQLPDPLSTQTWRPPETTANLFLSRIRQIVTALTPGTPSLQAKARVPGASHLADDQNKISAWAADHGKLEAAIRRCAFLGLLSPYFGCKLAIQPDEPVHKRVKFLPIEPGACGYEPFGRRFSWHTYEQQWSDLPKEWRPKLPKAEQPKAWEPVQVTEVYHEKFGSGPRIPGACPMSIFVQIAPLSDNAGRERKDAKHLGEYTYTTDLPTCPLALANFLDPAPKEDVPPAEVLSWVPLMRMIVQTLVQINREISTINKEILFDKEAISEDIISLIQDAPPGSKVYIPVDVDDAARGVNATMRPVEQNAVLNEYLAALQTYLALFDDVTGVGPIDRGVAANPRKSATEASSIVAASNRRNRDRLEVMANLWGDLARIHHRYQREIYGETVEIPLGNGLTHTINVPDPIAAEFAFWVDPVDLGHLSKRGEVDTYFNWLTTVTNVFSTFQGSLPRMVRESLRKMGNAMGVEDVDIFLDAPTIEQGPEDRYIEHLQTGLPIAVAAEDEHQLYVSYYNRIGENAVDKGYGGASVGELRRAIDQHNIFIKQQSASGASNQAPVPGVNASGDVDNQIQAALAAGLAPPATAQTLGGGRGGA